MSRSDQISVDVAALQEMKSLYDVRLIGGLHKESWEEGETKSIEAHKLFLALQSTYFENLWKSSLNNKLTLVSIPGVHHKTLQVLIDYIYRRSDRLKLTKICSERSVDEVLSLLDGSKRLMLKEVTEICEDVLLSSDIQFENCLNLFRFGALTSPRLINKAADFIVELNVDNFVGLTRLQEFLFLGHDIIRLLQTRLTCPPHVVLEMIITWWKYDVPGRKEFGTEFLNKIPWAQINKENMTEIIFNNTNDKLKALLLEPLVINLYSLIPQQQPPPPPTFDVTISDVPIPDNDVDDDASFESDSLPCLYSNTQELEDFPPTPESSSSFSSGTKRKNYSNPYVDMGVSKRQILNTYLNTRRSSTTTANQALFECTLYYIGYADVPVPNEMSGKKTRTKYFLQSFDLHTGESKRLKYCKKHEYSSLVYNDQSVYIIGGQEDVSGKKIQLLGETHILDLLENGDSAWRDTKEIPPMEMPVYDFQSVVLDNKIYSIGGAIPDNSCKNNSNKYIVLNTILQLSLDNPHEGWTPVTDDFQDEVITHPKCSARLALVDDKIYSIGGNGSNSSNQGGAITNDIVECFDPSQKTCIDMRSMPERLVGVATAVLGSKIYVLGGGVHYKAKRTTARVYDTEYDSWTDIKRMNKRRAFGWALSCNGSIFAVGGDKQGTIEKYDPQTDTWKLLPQRLPPGDFRSVAVKMSEWSPINE